MPCGEHQLRRGTHCVRAKSNKKIDTTRSYIDHINKFGRTQYLYGILIAAKKDHEGVYRAAEKTREL